MTLKQRTGPMLSPLASDHVSRTTRYLLALKEHFRPRLAGNWPKRGASAPSQPPARSASAVKPGAQLAAPTSAASQGAS